MDLSADSAPDADIPRFAMDGRQHTMSNERYVVVDQIPDHTSSLVAEINRTMAEDRRQDEERQAEIAGRYDADLVFGHLMQRIEAYQEGLKEDEEIGLQLANYGLATQLHIRSIGFQNPNLLEFSGLNIDGNECVLIQHLSQLNFMLIALKPVKDKPFRIGFGR
jgi:hypothetical protein